MRKKTRSILHELNSMIVERDRQHVIESRATNVIESAINLINEMTVREKEMLLNNNFETLWKYLWGDYSGKQYKNEEKSSREKFNKFTIHKLKL